MLVMVAPAPALGAAAQVASVAIEHAPGPLNDNTGRQALIGDAGVTVAFRTCPGVAVKLKTTSAPVDGVQVVPARSFAAPIVVPVAEAVPAMKVRGTALLQVSPGRLTVVVDTETLKAPSPVPRFFTTRK